MSLYAQLSYVGTFFTGTTLNGRVIVSIFDASTGLPTNGNNCVVAYTQNINGAVSNLTSAVPGLATEIYSGALSDSSTGFFTNFTITSVTPGSAPGPDPAADDLTIINVITTPESAIGADDGQVVINATSSFPAIQYSLDNVTWQAGNTFTGLHSGGGTAYVKDTNGGLKSVTYNVGLIGNILQSDPSVDLGNGNLSRWNAAFNNIWFKYQRKDFEITSIIQGAANTIIIAVNADMTNVTVRTFITAIIPGQPDITSPGDFVYIKTALYSGVYEVLGVTAGTLNLNCPYTADDTVGFVNINSLRPYYKILTLISYVDPLTGKLTTITGTNRPDSSGYCKVDLSSLLQSLVMPKDKSNYTLVNYRDMQLSASYQIQYAETWNGNTIQWTVISRPYYVLYAARQIQQLGGGNMQEFVPYLLGFQPAKWLTDFVNPVYNPGFPFDLGFIFSEYMVGLANYYDIVLLDINKNKLAGQSDGIGFLLNEDTGFLLNQDGSKFIIADQGLVNIPIVEHVGLNRLLINFSIPAQCWYFSVQLKYKSGLPSIINYSYTENAPGVHFADGGIQIWDNGNLAYYAEISASGSLSVPASHPIKFIAVSTGPSTAGTPLLTMTVTKNGTTVFAQTVPCVQGTVIEYDAIADINATYVHTVTATDGGSSVTPVNTADTSTAGTVYNLTKPLICRIDQNTPDRSVYLRWIGLTGSWNYYRFVYNQQVGLEVSDPVIIKNYITDWANTDTIEDVIMKSAGLKMNVYAENVSIDDIKGLQSVKYSPKVQMLTSQSPVKWQTIVVASGSFNEYETFIDQYSFGLTFNLPSINIQRQ